MLEPTLRKLIPHKVRTFAKLESGEPYHFDRWDKDYTGTECLYYWFTGRNNINKKRVPTPEIRAALQILLLNGTLRRKDFETICPIAKSDGPCGFAVVGRIFEALDIAVYSGRRDGFRLTDLD